ncbi:MAG: hypothetical protein R3321_03740 [Nitrososphaeraceae archaeon]|nr:hypothetical protein [Nitrososphaeraceae archaeon]
MNRIQQWFYQIYIDGESFLDSFKDWWYLVKNGDYEGVEPHGQDVFFTYLGRTFEEGNKTYHNLYERG